MPLEVESATVACSQRNCQSTFRCGLATFGRSYFILARCVAVLVHVVVIHHISGGDVSVVGDPAPI